MSAFVLTKLFCVQLLHFTVTALREVECSGDKLHTCRSERGDELGLATLGRCSTAPSHLLRLTHCHCGPRRRKKVSSLVSVVSSVCINCPQAVLGLAGRHATKRTRVPPKDARHTLPIVVLVWRVQASLRQIDGLESRLTRPTGNIT